MDIFKFLTKNLTSLNRNASKKRLISDILTSPQKNNGVVNLHRIDFNNAGDLYCAPHYYFKELENKQLDIYHLKNGTNEEREIWKDKVINNSLIIGGGGLLNRGSFETQMKLFEQLALKGKKTVIWGAGHNAKKESLFRKDIQYNINTANFGLVGTRDFSNEGEWIPCVSCLNTVFDENYKTIHETGIVFHKKTLKDKRLINKLDQYPQTSNTTDLQSLINFIGSCETIVTDSYHAMYWAMLLEKKVVVIPNSSKFFDFKYSPTISSFNNFENDLKKTQSYTGLLEECRSINLDFSKKVFDYLNI